MPSLTISDIDNYIAFWKAAYQASAQGIMLTWNGRTIKPQSPETCMNEIERLNRMKEAQSNNISGHDVSLADFSESHL